MKALNRLRQFWDNIKPQGFCIFCSLPHNEHHVLCPACKALLKPLSLVCSLCAHPLTDASFTLCGRCILKKPYFDKVITAYPYDACMRILLHRFKYQNALYLKTCLAEAMLDALTDFAYQPDCFIPIPMHLERIKQRGFNQAALLAKMIAKKQKSVYAPHLCHKIKNTTNQVLLNQKERKSNLKGAFHVHPSPYKKICLVDDVLTTGSTANELARLFKQQGALEIHVLCCARTVF